MAKLEIPIKVDLRSTDKIKTLIELLSRHQDALPAELVASLHELADCNHFEYTVSDFKAQAGNSDPETDFHTKKVMRVNPVLRRVTYLDENNHRRDAYPEKYRLGANGDVFIQWGH